MKTTSARSVVVSFIGLAVALLLVVTFVRNPSAKADEWSNGHLIHGRIYSEYSENRTTGFNYGVATSDELGTVRGGAFQRFSNNANIYWNPAVANGHAQTVGGKILEKWGSLNYERGILGFPTTREVRLSGGAFNHFEGGSIYWTQASGAHTVWGQIRDAWFANGAENGIGYPVTDEIPTPRYGGFRQVFDRASIYWSPTTGARIVGGEIGNTWGSAQWEMGNYGYPITNEFDIPGGRRQVFQGGPIDFFWDRRPVGKIRFGQFRWQDFIPYSSISVRCDKYWTPNTLIIDEKYNGNDRSWDPEGSFKVRMDIFSVVDQSNRGAKSVEYERHVDETVQTISFVGPAPDVIQRKTASADNLTMTPGYRESGDFPDVVRFSVDNLAANPFCDIPIVPDGISAKFNAGFSATTGAFWIDGTRRKMPNAEAYVRDLATPGRGGWEPVGKWELTNPGCLIADDICGRADVKAATASWKGGAVIG